jgi:hypothetical protein
VRHPTRRTDDFQFSLNFTRNEHHWATSHTASRLPLGQSHNSSSYTRVKDRYEDLGVGSKEPVQVHWEWLPSQTLLLLTQWRWCNSSYSSFFIPFLPYILRSSFITPRFFVIYVPLYLLHSFLISFLITFFPSFVLSFNNFLIFLFSTVLLYDFISVNCLTGWLLPSGVLSSFT